MQFSIGTNQPGKCQSSKVVFNAWQACRCYLSLNAKHANRKPNCPFVCVFRASPHSLTFLSESTMQGNTSKSTEHR